jgi:hypothetical protein
MIKYCKRDDAPIRAWCAEYEDCWGTRMHDIVSEWRPHSPALQHHYPPSQHPHQPPPSQSITHHIQAQHQQVPHRRIVEVRNPNQLVTGPRTSSHQHDSSYNRRSPGSSSPTAFPLGRSLDDLRLHNSNGGNNATRSASSHPHPHADRDASGRTHAGSCAPLGQGQGGNSSSGESTSEREKEVNARRLIHDLDIDPALQNGVNGENGGQRGAGGTSGDGPHSLPSLKSSGLLDSWSSMVEGGNGQKQITHGINGGQRPSPPRRSPPHTQAHPHSTSDVDARLTTLVSMPVGLPWLANESR